MPIKLKIYNQKAEAVGEASLSEKVFAVKINEALVHQAMVAQMSNERQVLAHTKDRSEVRGGGRKPWRQKGTGRARAGSSRSPIWIGGGVTFGPRKNRNFSKQINKKMKQKAVKMVLSDRLNENAIVILDKFKINEYKSKIINEIITNIENKVLTAKKEKQKKRSVLLINDQVDEKLKYSSKNLPNTKLINIENINILDLLRFENIIISNKSIARLEKKFKQD